MEYIIVPDTSIVGVNHGESCNIVYRDNAGELHLIDFEACAANFRAEHKNASRNCIGERKIDEGYFLFCTGCVKARIVFRSFFAVNLFRPHFLKGTKAVRFHRLQRLILEAGYTTFDLS